MDKILILLVFSLCAACEKPVSNVARNLECEWIHRYKICICVADFSYGAAMTIVPNRVCNHIEMEPIEIRPEKPTENSL